MSFFGKQVSIVAVISYFCDRFMKRTTHISIRHKISGIIMMLALAWLTVSIPFVYAAQQLTSQKIETTGKHSSSNDAENNPFANTTEEKTPSGPNILSEYLHDTHSAYQQIAAQLMHIHHIQVATYTAFHGELTVPPPKG
jgi:predicted PurR-regulated permease PerM